MKSNRVKQLLADGRIPVGHMVLEFGTRGIAQMLEVVGVDFVVLDMEHSPFSIADVANVIACMRATSVTPFVRIPQIEYHFIARSLDAGAMGVMVPNVRSAMEAQRIIEAVKYAPQGKRGVLLGSTHTGYQSVTPDAFMRASNENTTVICQIESQEGLDDLDAIASTSGVDVLWVGQFDLSQSLGVPGNFHHPTFRDALQHVVATAQRYGIAAAIQPVSVAQAEEWMGLGFNMISYSADIYVYLGALGRAVASVRKIASGKEQTSDEVR